MRSFLAGLLLLLLSSAASFAQVTGFVEGIGFDNHFRPECWTPILINLTSQVSEPMSYQLQVWQDDLDKDQVVYTKDITLSPRSQDKFQLYFLPRPTENGLPSAPNELQRALHVRVCMGPAEGKRPEDVKVVLDRLPVRFTTTDIEPSGQLGWGSHRPGNKLVLWVSDGSSKPAWQEYANVIGVDEDVDHVLVRPKDLGENVLYYDSVDAVLWLSGNADELDAGGARRLESLEQYLRLGGKLVVSQPVERGKIDALASLLPVYLKDSDGNWLVDIEQKPAFKPTDALPRLSRPKHPEKLGFGNWERIQGPISIARAKRLAPDALVAEWSEVDDQSNPLPNTPPFIVRHPYGLGSVTWVAQDLGNPQLTGPQSARWPYIWDKVFGWANDTHTLGASGSGDVDAVDKVHYEVTNDTVDLGQSLLKGMDFESKGAAYIFVAVLFFIVYWLAAGPGTYLYLSNRNRRELNWFVYGLWAFVATAITLGVVKLLLRGSAEVRHQTIVRSMPGQPAYMHSRIGLYIPRDGYETVELPDTSKETPSFITPYPIPPSYLTPSDYPASQDYAIPIHDDPQPVSVKIPYRSTLKKLQARWVGDWSKGVSGSPALLPQGTSPLSGKVTNQTGVDLRNVYFVINRSADASADDNVLLLPEWNKDQTLDLAETWRMAASPDQAQPHQARSALLRAYWAGRWYKSFEGGSFTGGASTRGDDYGTSTHYSFPVMSLFDRLPPSRNESKEKENRAFFLRRGGRDLNMSPAVETGQLVILAESAPDSPQPLPFPLVVDGSKVGGEGTVLYQFALPVDRSAIKK